VSTGDGPLKIWGSGDADSKAWLSEGVVLRGSGPWSGSVIALLQHLEKVGFSGAPRVVGSGFAPDGREMITYVPGTSPHPQAWEDQALVAIGALIRELHEATRSFRAPIDACWQPCVVREVSRSREVIGHGDLGPWTIVAESGIPVAFIDWEFAGPVDPVWDLADAAWLNVQLHDDDVAARFALPSAGHRAEQLRLLIDGYGLEISQRQGFVDKMIELAVHSARSEALRHQVAPETTSAADAAGYPVLWAITWRTRSASWMLRHRELLQRALV